MTRQPRLVITTKDGRTWQTGIVSPKVMIGRSSDADVVLADPYVSHHHARVFFQQGAWYVQDLGGTNGTLLNGQRVTVSPLHEGDRLTVGSTTIAFTAGSVADSAPAPVAVSPLVFVAVAVVLAAIALVCIATFMARQRIPAQTTQTPSVATAGAGVGLRVLPSPTATIAKAAPAAPVEPTAPATPATTLTLTPTWTPSATPTPAVSQTPTVTRTPSATPTQAASQTPTVTRTPSATPTPLLSRQLPNGTAIHQGVRSGLGELTVENGLDTDAVAVLTNLGNLTVYSFYIRGRSNYTFTGIVDASLYLYYTTGEDWDATAGRFTRKVRLSRFEDTLEFETTSTQYTTFRVTLQAVVGGTATTIGVNDSTFPNIK